MEKPKYAWQKVPYFFLKAITFIGLGFSFFVALFFALDYLYPLNHSLLAPPFGKTLYDKNSQRLYEEIAPDDQWRFKLPEAGVSPHLKSAVLLYEDQYFNYHPGVNPFSILRALFHNLSHQRKIGASTITMQLARMIQARPRNIKSKLIESFRALQLEYQFSKEEILDLYFTLAPYGSNLIGVEAASRFYFDTTSSELTAAQASYLALIPKNPNRHGTRSKKIPAKAERLRLALVSKMRARGLISPEESKLKPVLFQKKFARIAPHFFHARSSQGTEIKSKIDRRIQLALKSQLMERVSELKHLNIEQGAVLLYDNKRQEVVSWVGSTDYEDKISLGANDGVLARKSPGSALKPFVYALGFESGLITPQQMLLDIPMEFDSYAPRNFDSKNSYWISVASALRNSQNIPAVEINSLLDKRDLHDFLAETLILKNLDTKEHYGQALVLGSLEVNLYEVAKLYSILANRGKLGEKHFLREESTWLVEQILTQDFLVDKHPYYSVKTGTSANSRDFWTVAWNREYTLVVWMGDHRNLLRPKLAAREITMPLVHSMMGFLVPEEQRVNQEFPGQAPQGLVKVKTCQDSFLRDQPNCQTMIEDYSLVGVSPLKQCQLLNTQKLNAWMPYANQSLDDLVKSHSCKSHVQKLEPFLRWPQDGAHYLMSNLLPMSQQKSALQCYSNIPNSKVHFFLNGKHLKTGKSGERYFVQMPEGQSKIDCIDGQSLRSSSSFIVEYRL